MTNRKQGALLIVAIGLACLPMMANAADNPFFGNWALTLPNDGPGWLSIWQGNGYIDADLLWYGGSVVPVVNVCMVDEDTIKVTRHARTIVRKKDPQGKPIRTSTLFNHIILSVNGDQLEGKVYTEDPKGLQMTEGDITGKRIPPPPPSPDLSDIEYGDPLRLFNGENLDGWKLLNPNRVNGWKAEDGVLSNYPVQKRGEPHIPYGNIRTEQEFEDFNLRLEVKVPKGSNSGVYLRGLYEVQVSDSYGRPLDSHNMGAIYSRITPNASAEKPAGEWQTLDMTLWKRHITVILNGETIIRNQPVHGCTGGALTSDEFKPGPIYLQGDHGEIHYRNIVLTPIKN